MADQGLSAGIAAGPVHILFVGARASLLRRCSCNPDTFQDLMPSCLTWPGLEEWILQLVRCGARRLGNRWIFPTGRIRTASEYLPLIAQEFFDRIEECVLVDKTHQEAFDRVNHDYQAWASSVDLVEVFRLISWLRGVSSSGNYEFHHPSLHITRLLRPKVLASAEHIKKLEICPQRIWSLVRSTPSQEVSMLTLVPCMPSSPRTWSQPGHDGCVPDYCAHLYLDFTGVDQLHICSTPKDCRKTEGLFPDAELVAAVERQMQQPGTFVPTAWAFDGRSIIDKDQPFMAISHVWSDGTGTGTWPRGIVNECVYQSFVKIARKLNCEGIWWDAICLPTEKKARIHAINNMHNNYARATVTLVHDRYLSTMGWISAAEASFALVMSPWFTRGWTALELAVSRLDAVYVLFADDRLSKLADILTNVGEVTHAYHYVASDLIRRVMDKVNTLNDLLTALGPRYTSWARDKAIIAGLLVGVSNPASMSQIQVYQAVLLRLSKVEIGNLFHGRTTMQTSGFHWCPSDLFQMPPARAGRHLALRVKDNGDLDGYISLSCLALYSSNMSILPADNHPLMRARTEHAVANPRGYVLVKDPADFARGLILKSRLEHGEPMQCEIVGTVVLGSPDVVAKMQDHGNTRVRLCDVGDHEAAADESLYACAVAVKYRFDQGLLVACACLGLPPSPPDHVKSTTPDVTDPVRRWARLTDNMQWLVFTPILLAVAVVALLTMRVCPESSSRAHSITDRLVEL